MQARAVEPITDQPLALIDLLDGSFAVLRQRARVIVATVAGLVIPVALVQAWASRNALGGSSLSQIINDPTVTQQSTTAASPYNNAFFFGHGLSMVVTAVGGVAVSRIIRGWIEGDDVGAVTALRFTVRRSGAVLGAFALVHLAEAIGFVLVVVPGLAAIVLFSLTSPVLAIEELGPVASVKRSAELVRRRTGSVIGIILLLGLAQYGVSQAVGTMPNMAAAFIGPDRAWPLQAASNAAISLILVPVTGAAMCLTYLDIRFRTEGLDLRWRLRRQFATPDRPAP